MKAIASALLLALLLQLAPAASASDCTDTANKALYTDAQARLAACQSAVGFTLTPSLTAARTKTVCLSCTTLATMTRAKRFGDCTLTDAATGKTTTLQAQMDALFGACPTNTSPSKSGSGSNDIETPKPTTRAPTPTPTKTPSLDSSSGSRGTPVPTPTKKTPSPTSTGSPSPSSVPPGSGSGTRGGTNNTTGSTSKDPSAAVDNFNTRVDSAATIIYVVGIAAGVVLVVILIATVIVCRQRRQSTRRRRPSDAPFEYAAGHTPSKFGPSGSSGAGGGGSSGSGGAGAGLRGSTTAYLNETFLQPHLSGGGLWDDEVIVAARVPREKVLSDKLLSRGGYGEVYRGLYNGQVVAIKTLLPETKRNMKQIHAFLAEVKLMATLEHAQIVRFIGVAWDSLTDLCVVSEYMEGGDLRAALARFEDVEHRPLGFDHDKVQIALHIAHALTYLHSLQPVVLHRDLKSKNILLDQHLNAKLTDFGVSRERSDRTMTAGVGSSLWMAPEVMLGERYDEKSDIFSFGVVLSELDSHALPYAHVTEASLSSGTSASAASSAPSSSHEARRIPDTAILQMVSLGRLSVQFSARADPKIVAIARACVSLDPDVRPSAADVLYQLHNILKNY